MSQYDFSEVVKNFYTKYDIFVYPCKTYSHKQQRELYVTNRNNLKKYLLHPTGWRQVKRSNYRHDEITQEIKDNACVMGYVITGKYNNITVIDIDLNKKDQIKDKGLHNRIIKLITESNTLLVSTPSGGIHAYFKYEDRIPHKGHDGFNGIIDRLNTGGNAYIGQRNDGKYVPNYKPIQRMPEDLIAILERSDKNTEPEFFEPQDKKLEYSETQHISIDCKQLVKALEVVSVDPDYIDGKGWWVISGVLNKHRDEIPSCYELWDSWSKKGKNTYNKDKNKKIWDEWCVKNDWKLNINIIFVYCNRILQEQGKRLLKPFHTLIDYIPLDTQLYPPHEVVTMKYISEYPFSNQENNMIQSMMGTGKTRCELDMAQKHKTQLITINGLKTINTMHEMDLKERFGKENVYVINSDQKNKKALQNLKKHYLKYNYARTDEEEEMQVEPPHIVVCIDSCHKLIENPYFESKHNALAPPEIDYENTKIFLDEIHSTILHLYKSSTLKGKRVAVLDAIVRLIKNAKSVTMADGVITDVEHMFMRLCRGDKYKYVQNTYKLFDDIPMYIHEDNTFWMAIEECFKNKEPLIITSNSLKEITILKPYLAKLREKYEIKEEVKYFTSIDERYSGNISEIEDTYCVAFSPSIQGGLDHQKEVSVFSIVSHGLSLTPEQVRQQMARARKPKCLHLWMHDFECEELLATSFEEFKAKYKHHYLEGFQELCSKSFKNGVYEYQENEHTDIYFMIEYHTNVQKSDYHNNLIKMCKKGGFKVVKDYTGRYEKDKAEIVEVEIDNDPGKNLLEMEDYYVKQFDTIVDDDKERRRFMEPSEDKNKFEEGISGKLECLNITINDVWTFKQENTNLYTLIRDICLKPGVFEFHMKVCKLLRTNDSILSRLAYMNRQDLVEINAKSVETQILAVKQYFTNHLPMAFTDENDITTLQYDSIEEYNDREVKMQDSEYQYIKNMSRTTKPKPRTRKEAFQLGYFALKSILGSNILEYESETIHDKTTRKKVKRKKATISQEKYQLHIELMKMRVTEEGMAKYNPNVRQVIATHYENGGNRVVKDKFCELKQAQRATEKPTYVSEDDDDIESDDEIVCEKASV